MNRRTFIKAAAASVLLPALPTLQTTFRWGNGKG
jgi:hypothetical protein